MDNLKELQDRKDEVLDPNTPPGSGAVLVAEHNELEGEIITKLGRYTGYPFQAVNMAPEGIIPVGNFYWNGSAMNNTSEFQITLSGKTVDGNNIEHALILCMPGDKIKYKDFVGRSSILEIVSKTKLQDGGGTDYWQIIVKGFTDNPNYTFQLNESYPCIIDFIKQSSSNVPDATDTVRGKAKLYDNLTGNNTDGAPTQRAVNEGLAAKPNKTANTEYETPGDPATTYRVGLWTRVGGFFRLPWLKIDDAEKSFSVEGSAGVLSPLPTVTDNNWFLKTVVAAAVALKIGDDVIGNYASMGMDSGKKIWRFFSIIRMFSGSVNNETEFISQQCPAATSVFTLKTIPVPVDSSITIDVSNINTYNAAQNGIRGRAQFFVKRVGATVTDVSKDAFRYANQYSYVKSPDGTVTNADARIDISISGTDVLVNFVNVGGNLTTVQVEIKYNNAKKPE